MSEPSTTSLPLRFVVLRHEGIAEPHFDLLFEQSPGSDLLAFRSPQWPIINPTPLIPLPNHRRDYLIYEGDISMNRGHVHRIAEGTCHIDTTSAPATYRIWIAQTHEHLLIRTQSDGQYTATPL